MCIVVTVPPACSKNSLVLFSNDYVLKIHVMPSGTHLIRSVPDGMRWMTLQHFRVNDVHQQLQCVVAELEMKFMQTGLSVAVMSPNTIAKIAYYS